MISIYNPDHFLKAVEFAVRAGVIDSLRDKLNWLNEYDEHRRHCHLHPDTSAHSWVFVMERADRTFHFNGGLIWSPHSNSWGIHT